MKGSTLKIPSLKRRPWTDKDAVLVHAAFTILMAFVEDECDGVEGMREQAKANKDSSSWQEFYKEAEELYLWWVNERKDPWHADTQEEMERLHQLDTNNLVRLVRARSGMWT